MKSARDIFRECVCQAVSDLKSQYGKSPEARENDAMELAEIRYKAMKSLDRIEYAQKVASQRMIYKRYMG